MKKWQTVKIRTVTSLPHPYDQKPPEIQYCKPKGRSGDKRRPQRGMHRATCCRVRTGIYGTPEPSNKSPALASLCGFPILIIKIPGLDRELYFVIQVSHMGLKGLSVHGSKFNAALTTPEGKEGLYRQAAGHHGLPSNLGFPKLLLGILHNARKWKPIRN